MIKHAQHCRHCWLPSRGLPMVNNVTSQFSFSLLFVGVFASGNERRRGEKCNLEKHSCKCFFFSFYCLNQFCLSPSPGTLAVMNGIVEQKLVCRLFTLNAMFSVIQTWLCSWHSWQGGNNCCRHPFFSHSLPRLLFHMVHLHCHWWEPHRGSLASHKRPQFFQAMSISRRFHPKLQATQVGI